MSSSFLEYLLIPLKTGNFDNNEVFYNTNQCNWGYKNERVRQNKEEQEIFLKKGITRNIILLVLKGA